MADKFKSQANKSYLVEGLGETKPKILLGGKDGKFVPNLNLSFECDSGVEKFFLNLNKKDLKIDSELETFASDTVKLSAKGENHIWHIDEDGNFKWDMRFDSKPSKNVFEWELLSSPAISFFYQPELTQEEIDKGMIRPPKVVGSYAVYCDKGYHCQDQSGQTIVNYRTGKLCHIYRPLCTDALGVQSWADLLIVNGKLSITIPQGFLDSASYPVTLDPTFGYTTAGGSQHNEGYNRIHGIGGSYGVPGSAGSVTKISAHLKVNASTHCEWRAGLYDASGAAWYNDTSADLVSPQSDNAGDITNTTAAWLDATFSTSASVTAKQYAVCIYVNADNEFSYPVYISYDTTASVLWIFKTESYPTWPATLNILDIVNDGKILSIYATYTESGGTLTIHQSECVGSDGLLV